MAVIPWGLILKLLAIVGIVAAIAAGIWYGIHSIQNQGRQLERTKWLAKQAKDQEVQAVAFGEAVKRVQKYRDEQEQNLMEVLNGKDKAIADLERRERAARDANRGLYVHAGTPVGSGNPGKGETPSAGLAGGGPGRVRLSLSDESNIRTDYGLAQRVVIQYNACREKLRSLVTVVPDADGGSIPEKENPPG